MQTSHWGIFMRFVIALLIVVLLSLPSSARSAQNTYTLEEKIAYQQGRFGALYDLCGTPTDRKIISSSIDAWREETLEGFQGPPEARADLVKAFDQAIADVKAEQNYCNGWNVKSAAAWQQAVKLSMVPDAGQVARR
jgi:hypothetical protein